MAALIVGHSPSARPSIHDGNLPRGLYGHWTSATNILRRCWRHICFD